MPKLVAAAFALWSGFHNRWRKENLWTNMLGIAVLTLSIIALITSAVLGLGRTSQPYSVVHCYYAAGKILLRGESPYDYHTWQPEIIATGFDGEQDAFAYPPTFAPFCMAMASLPNLTAAKKVMLVLNLIALVLLAILSVRLVTNPEQPRLDGRSRITLWLIPSLVIASPFTDRVIWEGQSTLLAGSFLVGGWYLVRRGRDLLAGVLFGFATMKPQVMILPFLWVVLDRRWKTILMTVAIAAVLSSYVFWLEGPFSAIQDWLLSLAAYQTSPDNRPGSAGVISLTSLLATIGVPISLRIGLLIAVLITLFVWQYQSRFCRDDVLSILVGIQLGLVFGHEYDLVLLAPMAAAFWLYLADYRTRWPLAAAFVLVIFIIGSMVHLPGLYWLSFLLGIMLLLALGLLIYLSLRTNRNLRECNE